MDNNAINSHINSSIIATSSTETIFLSSTGDVLVCKDFDDQHLQEINKFCLLDGLDNLEGFSEENIELMQKELDGCSLTDDTRRGRVNGDGKWGEQSRQQRQRKEEEYHMCCDMNSSCHSKGLCGGAESSNHRYNTRSASRERRRRMKPRPLSSKSTSNDSMKKERGVAYVNSTESGKLTIQTSTSIDEEYDEVDMNDVTLGDHDQFLTGGSNNSPTPLMSFDYSCYEPPTPEASRSFDYEDRQFKHMNGEFSRGVSMPNLTEDEMLFDDNIYLPTGPRVPLQKQTLQPHPISPRSPLFSSPREPLGPSGLAGIPTFLSHLSQIRITRVSSHPKGHHVLLVSDEGLLFSYGSNTRGQLGLGKQHSKVSVPQLITPLLENGGKTVNCAAGLDYSLVVVRTEGDRIAHRHKQMNERNAHQQMYAFGNNENNKLGLLDPKDVGRRRRKSIDSFEPPSPSSFMSPGSIGEESTCSSTASSDVYLPRRVALHCKVISKKDSPTTHQNKVSLPFGIFSLAASVDHSAALVKRPSGAIELYTWGRGDDGKLGLPMSGEQIYSPRGWQDTICCTSVEKDDETLNTLIDEPGIAVKSNQSTSYYVSTPTMVTSLSLSVEKHPPLPKKNKFLPRSPRKPRRNISPKNDNSFLLESEYVVKLALGSRCTHLVTSTGRWLVFGSSSDGLLALGGNVTISHQPVEVKLPLAFGHEKMSSISIGETHGIALTTSGKAFTWGTSHDGALGRNNQNYIPIPQPIALSKTKCQDDLNSILTNHLKGIASTHSIPKTPRDDTPSPISYIHAGKDLSVFITNSGCIQTCGRRSGRLGQGDVLRSVSSPKEIFGGVQLWRDGS